MNDVYVFHNTEFGDLEILTIDGKPYFPATECAKIIGHTNPERAVREFCKGVTETVTPSAGGNQKKNYIPEGDLYRLIVRSQIPAAEKFERWVFDEVLPQIRKTGGYIPTSEADDEMTILAKAVLIGQKTMEIQRAAIEAKDRQISELKPKALFADAVSVSDGTILIGELAKILKGNGVEIGQNRLFEKLRRLGYLIRRKGTDYNAPTQKAMELGLFKVKETAITHSDGHVTISKTTKVTGKGQQYFVNLFLGDSEKSAREVLA
jgi:anti-repressor protein